MKKTYIFLLIAIINIVSIIFVYNDHFLYSTPILKITNIDNIVESNEPMEEKHYSQNITGKIMNGEYKGKVFSTTHSYSESQVLDNKIESHSELFVEISSDGESIVGINNIKRDKYLLILILIFIDLILFIDLKKGFKTLVSLALNVLITGISIYIFMNNYLKLSMLLLYLVVSIIFIVVSLYVTNGRSKKTLAAIASSIISLLISFSISFMLIKINESNIYIWIMDYVEAVYDYYNFLYVSVLLSGLGAFMDIAITISSALNELIMKNKRITKKALVKSGIEISKDIVGTMINVMLFTCFTSIIPTVVLATRNHIPLFNALEFYGNIELTIVLCTCIGIVLTIPISLFTSIFILKNSKVGGK